MLEILGICKISAAEPRCLRLGNVGQTLIKRLSSFDQAEHAKDIQILYLGFEVSLAASPNGATSISTLV